MGSPSDMRDRPGDRLYSKWKRDPETCLCANTYSELGGTCRGEKGESNVHAVKGGRTRLGNRKGEWSPRGTGTPSPHCWLPAQASRNRNGSEARATRVTGTKLVTETVNIQVSMGRQLIPGQDRRVPGVVITLKAPAGESQKSDSRMWTKRRSSSNFDENLQGRYRLGPDWPVVLLRNRRRLNVLQSRRHVKGSRKALRHYTRLDCDFSFNPWSWTLKKVLREVGWARGKWRPIWTTDHVPRVAKQVFKRKLDKLPNQSREAGREPEEHNLA